MPPSVWARFRDLADEIERIGRGMDECYEAELILYLAKRWGALADDEPVREIPPYWPDFDQEDDRTLQ